MKKKIIGLIGPRCENKNNPFLTYTKFIDNYAQKIKEAGALAIGIIFPKNIFSEDA